VIPLKDDNPTRRTPVLTIGLIAACVVVFVYQTTLPDDLSLQGQQAFACEWGLVADNTVGTEGVTRDACDAVNERNPGWVGTLSSLFLHGSLLHLAGNMLFLWVFGNNIEDRLGRLRFLPFYLLCGIAAGLAQAYSDPGSTVPLIGASGAISGVLGGYLVLYPRVRVWTVVMPLFFLPFRLPAWLWLIIYFGLQFVYLGGEATAGGGGVAYLAHIGGFIAGAVTVRMFLVGRADPPPARPALGALR
jgi:membrane associated rhomboid family serine protease